MTKKHTLNDSENKPSINTNKFLSITEELNLYGLTNFDEIIIASLAQECPVLLIGTPGTAKTQLTLKLFETLSLNFAHYNASMLNLDELIGYPVKLPNGRISYQPLPCSCWDKEAIFIDEISRCKPDTQNKFFSIIYEKRIYGMFLDKLIYRWAAMNPPKFEDDDITPETLVTEGTYPLDVALADRFNYILKFPNFHEMEEDIRYKIISKLETHKINKELTDWLKNIIYKTKLLFNEVVIKEYFNKFDKYLICLSEELKKINIYLSTRRIRIIKDNILWYISAVLATGKEVELYWITFNTTVCSLPQRAYLKVDDSQLNIIISNAIKRSIDKYNPKALVDYEKDIYERIFLVIELLLENNIEKEKFEELLISLINKSSEYKRVCFIVVGFRYLSKMPLSADLADTLCYEFLKYTSDITLKLKNNYDTDNYFYKITPSFKSLALNEKNLNFSCDQNILEIIDDEIKTMQIKHKPISDAIYCSIFNYFCEINLKEQIDFKKFINSYIKTFLYFNERFENIFKEEN